MSDLISRKAVLDWLRNEWDGIVWHVCDGIELLPSAEKTQLSGEDATKDATFDCISRQAAIDALGEEPKAKIGLFKNYKEGRSDQWFDDVSAIVRLPSAEKTGEWTTDEVAELLFNLFGDDCACNFNGIDEWLPERCKYTEIAGECPNPKEKHGCWMQFLLQGGADMRGESDG